MAKLVRSYRISTELDILLKDEAERLSEEHGKRVSEADVIEVAVVAWLGGQERSDPEADRRALADAAMREAETRADQSSAVPIPKRAESAAQRKVREAKEHAEKLAEADITARMVGRDDIEYDLENIPRQSVLNIANQPSTQNPKAHYEVRPRESKPLTRPHGSTEAKRRREQ